MKIVELKFILGILCILCVLGCNSKTRNNNQYSEYSEVDTIINDSLKINNENIKQTEYTVKIDTIITKEYWPLAYDVVKDSIFFIEDSKLYVYNEGNPLFLYEIQKTQIPFFPQRLFILKDFIVVTTGDLTVDVLYLFKRDTMELTDSIHFLQIHSRINENICLFTDLFSHKDGNFNNFLIDFNTMDTIFIFPENKYACFFNNKYYVFNNTHVEVYDRLDNKCFDFEKNGYYNNFGQFKGNYFGLNKEKLHFYDEVGQNGIDINFERQLNFQKIELFNNNLYVYGWVVIEELFYLLRYEIDKNEI